MFCLRCNQPILASPHYLRRLVDLTSGKLVQRSTLILATANGLNRLISSASNCDTGFEKCVDTDKQALRLAGTAS